jgi:hypothetical protein
MTNETFTFDPVKHVYTLDDKPLTGVTTILGVIAKPNLIQWAADMAVKYIKEKSEPLDDGLVGQPPSLVRVVTDEVLEEARLAHRKKKEKAGELGTDVHAQVEELIKLALQTDGYIGTHWIRDDHNKQIKNFIEWAAENNVKFLASEKRLYSTEHWYAGTADIICEIDSKRYVGDIKTSSGIYPEAYIQASAYAMALQEMEDNGNPEKKLLHAVKPMFDGVVIVNLRKDGGFEYRYNYDLEGNFKCFLGALTIYRHMAAIK